MLPANMLNLTRVQSTVLPGSAARVRSASAVEQCLQSSSAKSVLSDRARPTASHYPDHHLQPSHRI